MSSKRAVVIETDSSSPEKKNKSLSHLELLEELEFAKSQGWRCITSSELNSKGTLPEITQFLPPYTRGQMNASTLLLRIFNERMIDHIVNATNSSIASPKRCPHYIVSKTGIVQFISFIIYVCGNREICIKELLRSKTKHIISRRLYDSITLNISFDIEFLFREFNKGLKDIFMVFVHIGEI